MNDTLTVNGRERWSAARISASPRAEITSATSSDKKKPHDAVNGSSSDVSGRAVASGMTIGDAAVVAMVGCVQAEEVGTTLWYTAAHGCGRLEVMSATHREHWSG